MRLLRRILKAVRKQLPVVLLGVFPLVVLGWALVLEIRMDDLAVDFHHELYPETRALLRGDNPFPSPDAPIMDTTNAVWPVAAAILAAPLAVLPATVADIAATLGVLACFVGALLLLDVRDWRVYGTTLLWPPVINAYQSANLTLPLCLACALVWRYRQRTAVAGVTLGVALAVKFFLWPLVLWLAVTGRVRAAAVAVGIAFASLVLLVPYISLADYFRLVRKVSDAFDGESYTIYGLLTDAGVASGVARAAMLAAGFAVLAGALWWRSFALSIGAALLLSPIVWLHFFALLAVPLAIASPTFALIWLVPLVSWLAEGTYNGAPWQSAVVLGAAAVTIGYSARHERNATTRSPAVSRLAASTAG